MKQPQCICRHPDARTCFELRHLGPFDDPDELDPDETCDCHCHSGDWDGRTGRDDEDFDEEEQD